MDFTLNGLATDLPYKNTLNCGGPDTAVEESQARRRKQGNRILRRGRFRVRGNLGMVKWRCGFHDKVQKKKKFHVANGRFTNKCQILSEKGWKGMFLLKKNSF